MSKQLIFFIIFSSLGHSIQSLILYYHIISPFKTIWNSNTLTLLSFGVSLQLTHLNTQNFSYHNLLFDKSFSMLLNPSILSLPQVPIKVSFLLTKNFTNSKKFFTFILRIYRSYIFWLEPNHLEKTIPFHLIRLNISSFEISRFASLKLTISKTVNLFGHHY